MNPKDTLFKSVTQINKTSNETIYQVCLALPPNVDSDGIWGAHDLAGSPMRSSFPVFELQIIVIFIITQLCHFLLKRLGLPLFISQMTVGIILGPSLPMGPLTKFKHMLFPYGSPDTLTTITSLGFSIFIFLNGVQMDFTIITRAGRKAWLIALIGLIAPLAICFSTVKHFTNELNDAIGRQSMDVHVVYITQTTSSFAVIASLLIDLKMLNTELGRIALSSALLSEIVSVTVRSIGTTVVGNLHDKKMAIVMLVSLFAFSVVLPLMLRPLMFWIIKNTPEGRPVRTIYIYVIIVLMLCSGSVSRSIGQSIFLGPFILGLAVPDGPPLGSALVDKLELFGTWFLLPIFITTCVMKVDLSLEYTCRSVMIIGALIILAHLVKVLVCWVTAICCKMPIKDASILALVLNFKGVVDVGLFASLYDRKLVHSETFSLMMLSIMVTAGIVQSAIRFFYDPSRKYASYQTRNIMNLKHNMDLRIVACIHKPCHINPTIDVLKLCPPMEESPITVDVLHLIELVGRSSPVFITHGLQKKVASSNHHSFSENIILAFDLFEHDYPKAVSVNTYTVLSPVTLMHEDICHLALDKLASFIILPFHRRWSIDGQIDCEDKKIRSLNCMVLERAPCSVGILVNRSSHPITNLAVIFLGGKDDREALWLAKRATRDPMMNLVVYHFVAENETKTTHDAMLDNAVLRAVKLAEHSSFQSVTYIEITVEDGPKTASILHAMADKHDFFIVGRRHEINTPQISGLVDWNEFPEMGVIGDFLASPDFESKASVLVVQQHEASK